jgi:cell division control protein 7
MRFPNQTGALDVWSAGIMLLTVLSHKFPFFNSNDDHDALVEMTFIFGYENMKEIAKLCGRNFLCEIPDIQKQSFNGDLKKLIQQINPEFSKQITEDCYDFLSRCLDLNMYTRIDAASALEHAFLS